MTTARFNLLCKLAALLFLVLTVGGKTAWYEYRGLGQPMDFQQYYMAGLIALHGEWDALYPIPNPESAENPGFAENSRVRPAFRRLAVERGLGEDAVRYMQPPPAALLFIPLAFFPFKVAYFLWIGLLILAAWGIALQAGRIFAMSRGHDADWSNSTKLVGIIILLVAVSPQAHRWIRVGNMSVLLGWLIGFSTIELARGESVRGAAAMVVGTVSKYAQAALAPLFLALRRWRTIGWGAAMLVVWLVVSYFTMGAGPFEVFMRDISPTLGRTGSIGENQALYPTMLRMLGLDGPPLPEVMEVSYAILRILVIVTILATIFLKPRIYWEKPGHVFAAALALVSWLLVFSPITWEHYHAYLAPFWGWLVYQGTKSWPRLVLAAMAIGLSYLPTSLLLHQVAGGRFRLPEPLFSHLLCGVVLQLALAMWVLAEWHLRRPGLRSPLAPGIPRSER